MPLYEDAPKQPTQDTVDRQAILANFTNASRQHFRQESPKPQSEHDDTLIGYTE